MVREELQQRIAVAITASLSWSGSFLGANLLAGRILDIVDNADGDDPADSGAENVDTAQRWGEDMAKVFRHMGGP